MPTSAPTLETQRLRLRAHRLTDFDHCCAMWGDAEVTRHISGRPFTAEEVWARILRYTGHWAMLGYGFWLIEEKDSGAFVGEIGLADFHRDIAPAIAVPEAGWVLSPSAAGHGYATEALREVLAWSDANLSTKQVACIINAENTASFRVAEKCGFGDPQPTLYHDKPVRILHRSRL